MSTRKILIIVLSVFLTPVILFCALLGTIGLIEDGFFENYSGWREVEIPTDTEVKATIKMPENWNFVVENGRIKIIDTDGNVIAVECYEDWLYHYYKDGVRYTNKNDLNINSELPESYRNLDNYEYVVGASSPCYLYQITVDGKTSYALLIEIMDSIQTKGDYNLLLLFDSSINDIDFFDKIQKSHRWAGWIDE